MTAPFLQRPRMTGPMAGKAVSHEDDRPLPDAARSPTVREDPPDRAAFLHALDALHQGLAFFECSGTRLHANRAFDRLLKDPGGALAAEIDLFLEALCALVRLRAPPEAQVTELGVRRVPLPGGHVWLRGSHLGMNLFGRGPSILITLEPHAPDPFSPETLRERFGFSRQEARVARLLAEGHQNKQIARTLGLSAHTVRHYLERVFQKLEVRSRAEVVSRILRE